MPNYPEAWIGRWISDPSDPVTLATYGSITQIFDSDGRLTYIAHSRDKDEVMLLTYVIEGDELVTNQPSSPAEFRIKFAFDAHGRLLLDDGSGPVFCPS